MSLGHNCEWQTRAESELHAHLRELQLVGPCALHHRQKEEGFQGYACWGGWEKWSLPPYFSPGLSSSLSSPAGLSEDPRAFDRRRLQGASSPSDPSILDLLPIRAPRLDSSSPRAHGRGPAELLAPFLSCQGDPSYLAMGSPSCAKQTPVRTNLDHSPGPGSTSFLGPSGIQEEGRETSPEAPDSVVPTG